MFVETLTAIELIALIVCAIAGSALVTYVCYIAAYVKHKNEILEAKQNAALAGEEYPSYKVDKVATWYSGYKLAAVVILILGALIGVGIVCLAEKKVDMTPTVACIIGGVGSLIGSLAVDKFIVHPIADDRFFNDVETPLVEKFLEPVAEEVSEATTGTADADLEALIKEYLKKKLLE